MRVEDVLDTVICGDALEVMRDLPDKSVDAIVTDPPYGFNRFVGDEPETLIALLASVFVEAQRILKDGAWAFVFMGTGRVKETLNAIPLDFQRLLWLYKPADCTFPYRGWLLKSEAIGLFSKGSPTPLVERRPYLHDCYMHRYVGQEGIEGHPCVKPLAVVRDLVSRVEGVILDPFAGSGTTLVACRELGRHYIGIDISPEYCAMARKRIAEIPPSLFDGEGKEVLDKESGALLS